MKNFTQFFILILLTNPISADDLKTQLDRDIQGVMTKVTDWRHHFHQYPELSNREYNCLLYTSDAADE